MAEMRGKTKITALVAVVATGFLSGCRLNRPFPPQPVKIVGASFNPGLGVQMLPSLGPGEKPTTAPAVGGPLISARGDGEIPPLALDPLLGRLVAKERAKQAARRNLARKIEAIELRPGLTLGEVLRQQPEKRKKMEELLRNARVVSETKNNEEGKYTVFLSIGIGQLNEVLKASGTEDEATSFTVVELPAERFRRRAEKEAIENARIHALEYLKALRLPEGETLGDRMLRDDRVDNAVRALVDNLQPIAVDFHSDGSCEASVIIDLSDVRRIIGRPRRRPRINLPVRFPWRKTGYSWRRSAGGRKQWK